MRLKLSLLFVFLSYIVAAQSTDNFDSYANASDLSDAANWVEVIGPADSVGFKIYKPASDGELNCNQAGSMVDYYVGTFSADQYSQIVLTASIVDKFLGVAVRITNTGSTYCWLSDNSYSYFVEINNETEDWANMELGAAWQVGHTYKLEAEGTTIRFYDNGVLDASMFGDGSTTDATIASGNPGVAGYGGSTSTRADDWQGGNIACPSMTGGVIAADQSISSGENVAAFTSTSSASGGTGTITYTWFRSTATSVPDTTTWTKIAGEVATTLDYGTLTATTYFFRKATAATCGTAYSNVLTVSVTTYGGGDAVSSLKVFPLNIIRGDQISHDQEYILDGACANNDSVGRIYYNCTDSVFYDGAEDYQMTILTDASGGFKIVGQTLAVSDNTQLNESTLYSITVQVADTAGTNRYDTITCLVYVLETDSTIYAEGGAGVDGSGTKASPHNHATAITINPGYTLLLKRGTTFTPSTQITLTNTGNPTKWVRLGSYGTGARPILNGSSSGSSDNRCLLIAGSTGREIAESLWVKKVAVYDLDITGYTASASQLDPIDVYPCASDIEFRRVKVTGARWNGCFYIENPSQNYNHYARTKGISIILDDCEAKDNTVSGHGFKFEGGGVTATNLWGSGNTAGHFIDLTTWQAGNMATYVYGDNAGTRAILMRQPLGKLKYFVLKGSGGVEIAQPSENYFHPDSCVVSDGYIISKYYHGVTFMTDASSGTLQRADTVQRMVFRFDNSWIAGSATTAAVYFGTTNSNSVIRQCVAYGTDNTGVLIGSSDVTNLKLDHNIFYDLTYYGVWVTAIGSGGKFYNNTAYNNTSYDFYNASTTNIDFRNNSYQDRSGVYWSPSSSNYVFSTGNPYTDSSTDNYYPTVGGGLVNVGSDLSLTEDIVGTTVPQGSIPDIGAYEYLFPSPESPTEIPTVKHRVIVISL
jgi:hypothetical protein